MNMINITSRMPIGSIGLITGDVDFHGEPYVDWGGGVVTSVVSYMVKPIRDDDTNTVVSWSQCIWQPNQVKA